MALRLTGVSLAKLGETGQEPDFEALIGRAVDLLEGRVEVGADPDELRDRLLRGYRYRPKAAGAGRSNPGAAQRR